jgi:hypothetical protein
MLATLTESCGTVQMLATLTESCGTIHMLATLTESCDTNKCAEYRSKSTFLISWQKEFHCCGWFTENIYLHRVAVNRSAIPYPKFLGPNVFRNSEYFVF